MQAGPPSPPTVAGEAEREGVKAGAVVSAQALEEQRTAPRGIRRDVFLVAHAHYVQKYLLMLWWYGYVQRQPVLGSGTRGRWVKSIHMLENINIVRSLVGHPEPNGEATEGLRSIRWRFAAVGGSYDSTLAPRKQPMLGMT